MRVGGQSGAGDFPSKVGNRQAGDVTERNLLCARDEGEFLYVDEEGQDGDGAVRYRVTDFAGGYQLPLAVLHSWSVPSQERHEIPGWLGGPRERREMPHIRSEERRVGKECRSRGAPDH